MVEVPVLVFGEREDAEVAAEALLERIAGVSQLPRTVREALVGEDDDADAQWLVVAEPPIGGWPSTALAELGRIADENDGWVESTD